MASIYWTGGAATVAGLKTWTFATAGTIGDIITVTIGTKIVTYATTSATIATFLPLLKAYLASLSSSVYPEFAEVTWGNTTATITATDITAGKPSNILVATNSSGTTINSASSSTGTATVVSSGPEDISTAANYSGGAVPSAADTLTIDKEGARLKYGLSSQSAVLLAVRRITAQDVEIGLTRENIDGTAYPEYRAQYWQQTATSDYVNTKSGMIKLNHGTAQTTFQCDASGSGVETGVPAVLLCGTHASNAWNIFGGNVGFAWFAGDAARVNVGRIDAGAKVTCGIGCVIDTWNNFGGSLFINSAIAAALNHPAVGAAKTIINGLGAVAQITAQGGTIWFNSTGTLGGNTVLGNNAVFSLDQDQRTKTITNPIQLFSAAAQVFDSYGVVSGGLTLQYKNCVGRPVLKPNSAIVITAL
jgi:hypothetical protein